MLDTITLFRDQTTLDWVNHNRDKYEFVCKEGLGAFIKQCDVSIPNLNYIKSLTFDIFHEEQKDCTKVSISKQNLIFPQISINGKQRFDNCILDNMLEKLLRGNKQRDVFVRISYRTY